MDYIVSPWGHKELDPGDFHFVLWLKNIVNAKRNVLVVHFGSGTFHIFIIII